MDHQDAINYIREHLTTLHASPTIYEDNTCNVIYALEEFALPAIEKDTPKEVVVKREFNATCTREYYACPNHDCEEFIRYKHPVFGENLYPERCEFCGQSLEWN